MIGFWCWLFSVCWNDFLLFWSWVFRMFCWMVLLFCCCWWVYWIVFGFCWLLLGLVIVNSWCVWCLLVGCNCCLSIWLLSCWLWSLCVWFCWLFLVILGNWDLVGCFWSVFWILFLCWVFFCRIEGFCWCDCRMLGMVEFVLLFFGMSCVGVVVLVWCCVRLIGGKGCIGRWLLYLWCGL